MNLDYLQLISGDDLCDFFSNQLHDAFDPNSAASEGAKSAVGVKIQNAKATADAKEERKKEEKPKKFMTVNPEYADRLKNLATDLKAYLKDDSLTRPFLYLILGPPGAGKSFLIQRLIDYLRQSDSANAVIFQQANLSEMLDPRELHQLYTNIKNNTTQKLSTITLLDEFDIKWSGGSAIKYLINPIYDGKFWNGHEFQDLGKCAFFFAGSYLQDRQTLLKTQKLLAGVNLNAFLFDLYFQLRKENDFDGMQEIKEIQSLSYLHEKWRTEVDPRTDTIFYLSSLEKIKDFLSRVAGNIFELLDVSWPLHVTVNEFVVSGKDNVEPSATVKLNDVITYVMFRLNRQDEKEKKIVAYGEDENPLLEYKNMILCERLLRVTDSLKNRFSKSFKEDEIKQKGGVDIDRKLLNFLTVVPLINGMRSLEQLVSKLQKPENGKIETPEFSSADLSMMIYEAEKFGDPNRVWAELSRNNPSMPKPATDDIFIPLD